jgi:hypothetical protein
VSPLPAGYPMIMKNQNWPLLIITLILFVIVAYMIITFGMEVGEGYERTTVG